MQQRRLADARRTDQCDDLGRAHLDARAAQHAHDLRSEAILALEVLAHEEGRHVFLHSYRRTSTGASAPARRAGMTLARSESTRVAEMTRRKSPGESFMGR